MASVVDSSKRGAVQPTRQDAIKIAGCKVALFNDHNFAKVRAAHKVEGTCIFPTGKESTGKEELQIRYPTKKLDASDSAA